MTKMHDNEFEVEDILVYTLLKSQCSRWANLPLKAVTSSGTDNALFRLGGDYVVRLPRVDWAAESINKEYEWVPKLARFLEIPISEPVFKGSPDKSYPWSWIVAKWNEGCNPPFEENDEYELLAKDLANFLNELHGIQLANGPSSRRGISLKEIDTETKNAIDELRGEIDTQSITSLWNQLSNAPPWGKDPVWVHGDFLPGNILVQNNRLSAVIDFSCVGIGDPACDLAIAWSLLKPHSRRIFRETLSDIDDQTWERGRGWALSIALIMLPYYKHSNSVLTALARRVIENAVM
jgi:aminoglycoside phosphotransferase (APT) family kinase protein